jgi:hypothetical protein
MARATFVKKAQKDIPGTDIKKGDSYYWWKFRYGGKHVSKTPPRASQLTQSAYKSGMYDLQERAEDVAKAVRSGEMDFATAKSELESIASDVRDLGKEQSDNRDNMPVGLQDGEAGELLQTRYDTCETIADELDAIEEPTEDNDPDDDGTTSTEDKQQELRDQMADEIDNVSWDIE